MISAALSGLLAGYGIAIPVGAIAVVLITMSARAHPQPASWLTRCTA